MKKLNEGGWIYIAMDLKSSQRWKVGMTSQSDVYSRIGATANPEYFLVRGYAIPNGCSPREIEDYLHYRLENRFGNRILHTRTKEKSEWFEGEFKNLIITLEHYLRNILSGLLGCMGRVNEYKLIEDCDEIGKPFEDLIYDEVIWTFGKLSLPLSNYSDNPLIQNYIEHANSKCGMPYYSMVDICSGNLNQSEDDSIKAHAQSAYEIWYRHQGEHHTPDQCKCMFNHFYEKERANREKHY